MENDTEKMMQNQPEYYAAEARFVYLRDSIAAAEAEGKTPSESYIPFDNAPADEQQRWIEVAKHLHGLFCPSVEDVVERA